MIDVTGRYEDIRSINENKIKLLKKDDTNNTIIVFMGGSEIVVEESIKTLDARMSANRKEGKK